SLQSLASTVLSLKFVSKSKSTRTPPRGGHPEHPDSPPRVTSQDEAAPVLPQKLPCPILSPFFWPKGGIPRHSISPFILSTLTRRRELRPGMKRRRFSPKSSRAPSFRLFSGERVGYHVPQSARSSGAMRSKVECLPAVTGTCGCFWVGCHRSRPPRRMKPGST